MNNQENTKETVKSLVLFFLIMSLLLYFPSNSMAVNCDSLLNGDFNAQSREDRIAIAKSLIIKIELLDSFLPNLKPSEKEWVEQEQAAIEKIKDGYAKLERLKQLSDSPEYHQLKLKNHTENIKFFLNSIPKEKLKGEMLSWSYVSYLLSDPTTFNDAIKNLKRHGRLPKDIEKKAGIFPENIGYGFLYNFYGRSILEYIIIPYLRGTIK